jgi:hypothetical protein
MAASRFSLISNYQEYPVLVKMRHRAARESSRAAKLPWAKPEDCTPFSALRFDFKGD